MILELKDVLKRPKFNKYLNKSPSEYILLIEKVCLTNNSPKHYNMAPDKDDNYLYDFASIQKVSWSQEISYC